MREARTPIRLLTAVPICDGHDSAISTINLELIRHGMEVVYLGYHRSARDVVRAAIQEDVRAVGISSYNGGHVEFFGEVARGLRRERAGHIGIFGGGGGTITRGDAAIMQRSGVDRIFFAGTAMGEMIGFVEGKYGNPHPGPPPAYRGRGKSGENGGEDGRLARVLSEIEAGKKIHAKKRGHVIGITGPGGAGKTTLIDELVLRFLREFPARRLAILSHDPSLPESGALLGDRAAMIYSQDDRVFMRSLATRGAAGGLARRTRGCLEMLAGEFEMVLVESVGIGQEAWPFAGMGVDRTVYVMGPEYGSTLQLRKIAMLDRADIVVVNKGDLPGARAAEREVAERISGRRMIATTAGRHADRGVDELYEAVKSVAG